MKKKILITGASGFVGSHLTERAFAQGFEVHAAVRKSSSIDHLKPFVHTFVFPDYSDIPALIALFTEHAYDYIIHGAALTKAKEEQQLHDVNVGFTHNLMHAALATPQPPSRIVFVSSLAAIGPVAYDAPLIQEDNDYMPVTAYGRSKRAAEQMIDQHFADAPITVVRPTAVYGPREKDLFILFQTMNKGVDAYIGRDPQKLSFIYVKDLADILLLACTASSSAKSVFNVTDGKVYARYAMAEIFSQVMHKKMMRLHIPLPLVQLVAQLSQKIYKNASTTPVIYPERLFELTAQNWGCDISRAQQQLGFQPSYTLSAGLQETLMWYKDNKWF